MALNHATRAPTGNGEGSVCSGTPGGISEGLEWELKGGPRKATPCKCTGYSGDAADLLTSHSQPRAPGPGAAGDQLPATPPQGSLCVAITPIAHSLDRTERGNPGSPLVLPGLA